MDFGGILTVLTAAIVGLMAGGITGAVGGWLREAELAWRVQSLEQQIKQIHLKSISPGGVDARAEIKAQKMLLLQSAMQWLKGQPGIDEKVKGMVSMAEANPDATLRLIEQQAKKIS